MKKLLIQLLEKWACKHEWKTYQKCDVYDEFSREIPSHLESNCKLQDSEQ